MQPTSLPPPPPRQDQSSWFQRNQFEFPSLCVCTTLGAVSNSIAFVGGAIGTLTSICLKMPAYSLFFVPLAALGIINNVRHVYSYWRLSHRLHKRNELAASIEQATSDAKKYSDQIAKLEGQIQIKTLPQDPTGDIQHELANLRICFNQREQLRIRWQQIAVGISRAMMEFDQEMQRCAPKAPEEGRASIQQILSLEDLQRAQDLSHEIHEARARWFDLISRLDRSLWDMRKEFQQREALFHQYERQASALQEKVGPHYEQEMRDLSIQQERIRADLDQAQSGLQTILSLSPQTTIEAVQEVAARTLGELSHTA